jgi:hypothetical protein
MRLVAWCLVLLLASGCSDLEARTASKVPPLHRLNWAYWEPYSGSSYSQNVNTTPAEGNRYLTFAEGNGRESRDVGDCANAGLYSGCNGVYYFDSMYEWFNNSSGRVAQEPFAGECATNGTQPAGLATAASETWYLHSTNGQGAVFSNRIVEFYPSSADTALGMMMNRNSAGYTAYVNQILQRCQLGSGTSYDVRYHPNAESYIMADNTWTDPNSGLSSALTGYGDSNVGGTPGTDDADGDLWNPANAHGWCSTPPCTGAGGDQNGGSYLSSTVAAAEVSPSGWVKMLTSFFSALKHADGTPFQTFVNGQTTTDVTLLNSVPNIVGGVDEGAFSPYAPASYVEYALDVCASVVNNTTKMFVGLNYARCPGCTVPGSPANLQARRWADGLLLLCYADGRVVDWEDMESAPYNDAVFPEEFVTPEGPLQTMQAPQPAGCQRSACTSHGSRDVAVAGTYPRFLYRREWTDCWVDVNGTETDEGPCAVFVNTTGSTQTITAAMLSQPYNYVLEFCTPVGGAADVPTCSGTSGGDIGSSVSGGIGNKPWGTGPGALNAQFFRFSAGYGLANNDAVWVFRNPFASTSF